MTAYIVRINNPWLRVPLWSVIWPLCVLDCVVGAIASGWILRLFTVPFWTFQLDMLALGVDGFTGETP